MHWTGGSLDADGHLTREQDVDAEVSSPEDIAGVGTEAAVRYLIGFGTMVASGLLLFWSEAAKCYGSTSFRIKLLLLLLVALNAAFFEIMYKPRMEQWEAGQSTPAGAKLYASYVAAHERRAALAARKPS